VLLRVCTPVLRQREGIDEKTGTNAVGSKKGEHNYQLDRDGAIIYKRLFIVAEHSKNGWSPGLQGSNNKIQEYIRCLHGYVGNPKLG
jgi:hypothetical protein